MVPLVLVIPLVLQLNSVELLEPVLPLDIHYSNVLILLHVIQKTFISRNSSHE